jgi:hypothetical protein
MKPRVVITDGSDGYESWPDPKVPDVEDRPTLLLLPSGHRYRRVIGFRAPGPDVRYPGRVEE